MKKKLLIVIFCLFFVPFRVLAEEVHIYLFYGNTCSICEAERSYLKELNNVKVHEFEVYDNSDNYTNMKKIKELYGISKEGVPFTVVGDTAILGYNSSRQSKVNKLIKKYSGNDYYDRVGVLLGLYQDEEMLEKEEDIPKEENKQEEIKEDNSSNWLYYSIPIIFVLGLSVYVFIKGLKRGE